MSDTTSLPELKPSYCVLQEHLFIVTRVRRLTDKMLQIDTLPLERVVGCQAGSSKQFTNTITLVTLY